MPIDGRARPGGKPAPTAGGGAFHGWTWLVICALGWSCATARDASGPPRATIGPADSVGAAASRDAADSIGLADSTTSYALPPLAAAADSLAGVDADSTPGAETDSTIPIIPGPAIPAPDTTAVALADSGPVTIVGPDATLFPSDTAAPHRDLGQGDEFFGRLTARGSYEIRSLATGTAIGREDWQLFEDDTGFRTLRATTELDVGGARSSRTATVTVTPELSFVEADLGSSVAGVESYATYRHAGDVLSVEAYGAADGQTRQQVRLPEDAVFVSQVFATRGWELASFDRAEESTRPAYLAGSAPGVLVGEVGTLSGRRGGQEDIDLPAGRFRTLRFEVPPAPGAASGARPEEGEEDPLTDRWWVLSGSRIPVAADLPSLGVRVELTALVHDPEPEARPTSGVILARGVYHHRLLRQTEPLAVESWTLSSEPDGSYRLESELTYADGQRLTVRARADSSFRVSELQVRRMGGRGGEFTSIGVTGDELAGESRGSAVGLAEQRLKLHGPVAFRVSAAALEGWAVAAAPRAAAGDSLPGGTATSPGEAPGPTSTYWLPAGQHPLGTLLELPPDVDLGEERLPTPARTFSTRRYASPAETPAVFRAVRWVFGPYRLPARVLFPGLGREAILVRYETPG
jgi:hypothetical protein